MPYPESLIYVGRRPSRPFEVDSRPDWVQASPAKIEQSLARAQARSAGGWVVLDASTEIARPRRFVVDGQPWVAWREGGASGGAVRVAPDVCPHMGARLSDGSTPAEGGVVCPWHGLRLSGTHGCWSEVPAVDDGFLVWAQLRAHESLSDVPNVPERPDVLFSGVVRMEAECEPEDIVANRLDPWHGAHYHPHSFATLKVMDAGLDEILVRVAYRIAGRFAVEVDCVFHAPTERSIVMTIVDGEGIGSVVETHATPLGPGRSAVIEATLATSDRAGVQQLRRMSRFVKPMIEKRAGRLWVEDVAYAEQRYAHRTREDQSSGKSVVRLATQR